MILVSLCWRNTNSTTNFTITEERIKVRLTGTRKGKNVSFLEYPQLASLRDFETFSVWKEDESEKWAGLPTCRTVFTIFCVSSNDILKSFGPHLTRPQFCQQPTNNTILLGRTIQREQRETNVSLFCAFHLVRQKRILVFWCSSGFTFVTTKTTPPTLAQWVTCNVASLFNKYETSNLLIYPFLIYFFIYLLLFLLVLRIVIIVGGRARRVKVIIKENNT